MTRVGFIGLGDMGGPIARNIIRAGFPTTLWARRDVSLAAFNGQPYRKAADPADLAANSDVVGLCVFGDTDVCDVMLGERGVLAGLAGGAIILVHSTISPQTVQLLHHQAAVCNVHVLDAPVSGSGQRAEDGQLAIMVGGDRQVFERALPVLRSYAAIAEYMGPTGSGQVMKTLNNELGSANLHMACVAIDIASQMGLDRDAATRVLRAASGNSFNLGILIDRLIPDPDFVRHAIGMVEKDTALFRTLREAAGLTPSVLEQLACDSIADLQRLAS